jgi:hypothetical protein
LNGSWVITVTGGQRLEAREWAKRITISRGVRYNQRVAIVGRPQETNFQEGLWWMSGAIWRSGEGMWARNVNPNQEPFPS